MDTRKKEQADAHAHLVQHLQDEQRRSKRVMEEAAIREAEGASFIDIEFKSHSKHLRKLQQLQEEGKNNNLQIINYMKIQNG